MVALLAGACVGADRLDTIMPVAKSTGTAFFASPAGDLFTAAHAVESCPALWIGSDRTGWVPAHIAALHKELDVALLRTAAVAGLPRITLAPSHPTPGALLTAIGYPGGGSAMRAARVPFRAILVPLPDERTMLRGMARPGMSGSPLIDAKGEVAGMLLARGSRERADTAALEARLGLRLDELALAVPAPWLQAVASLAGVPLAVRPGPTPSDLHRQPAAPAVVRVICADDRIQARVEGSTAHQELLTA